MCSSEAVAVTVAVTVGKTTDESYSAEDCRAPSPASSCSLRSAWELCLTSHTSELVNCTITLSLPPDTLLWLNASHGPLELTRNSSVSIIGNDAIIAGFEGMRAIYYSQNTSLVDDISVPLLSIVGITFQGFGNSDENGG